MKNNNQRRAMRKWKHITKSDESLMRRYGRGDATAFESLYLRHKDKLFNFLRRQCRDNEVAEELAHDAWTAVIRQASNYQPESKFITWLYKIAHNRLVDHWRKNGHAANALSELIHTQVSIKHEQDISNDIDIQGLINSLELLSPEQSEAIVLKIEGFTHREIAQITDSKRETVKSRLRYATKQLRAAMEVTS